ncbi:AbrB/MazE/SpoVT family DNA-binding domain-containing protein [Neolewinella antarctica]|uniref:Bifunctional DNA-binding transcriptional regulator/antitoxin component of YhaV-PrlF toxin-antitoxin module n=1 Tax=Neolewinella antarctica TaxID=442734 RepID=A0ABX0XGD2_9BACT|nr:AbrB/MazE/SpoVT family DNA-binding domain-containing protein [Neolewinella antarctica]NJC28388.1 bifunctional DNA-binding transcriptional regulator/antitoxin component of YhaV-PrlF toxin-antitoxin module [Neolewinella antarctica]
MTLTMDKFGRVLIPKALRKMVQIEPGGEVEVEVDSTTHKITLTSKAEAQKPKLTFDSDGFPLIVGGEPYPADFDTVAFLKESYEEYHKSRFGV